MKQLGLLVMVMGLLASCGQNYTPKPHGYFRIDLPKKEFSTVSPDCPFQFESAQYTKWSYDSGRIAEPCWLNLDYVPFNATLHLTYKPVGTDFSLTELEKDSRTLVYKHSVKAQDIYEEIIYDEQKRVFGVIYQLTGDAATPLQFYVTDSSRHYLRGVLYFNSHTNPDSIAPVQSFLTEDVIRLVKTLEWK